MSEIDPADIKFKWPAPKQTVEATPRPWVARGSAIYPDADDLKAIAEIARCHSRRSNVLPISQIAAAVNARLIVTAVNAYEANQALISELVGALEGVGNAWGCYAGCTGALPGAPTDGLGHHIGCAAARAALAKVRAK